jgi:hypothetical protein
MMGAQRVHCKRPIKQRGVPRRRARGSQAIIRQGEEEDFTSDAGFPPGTTGGWFFRAPRLSCERAGGLRAGVPAARVLQACVGAAPCSEVSPGVSEPPTRRARRPPPPAAAARHRPHRPPLPAARARPPAPGQPRWSTEPAASARPAARRRRRRPAARLAAASRRACRPAPAVARPASQPAARRPRAPGVTWTAAPPST